MNPQEYLDLLRNGKHREAFNLAYKGFWAVKKYICNNSGSGDEAQDIFQEALMVICQKAEDEQFVLTASVNTYLFSVSRNLWHEQLRRKNKFSFLEDEQSDALEDTAADIEQFKQQEEDWKAAEQVLKTLGDKCRDILVMFYSKSWSMEAIAERLGLKSENAAKTQKYKCLEQARKQLNQFITVA
jgi:RNA polymerase sigma factor (sigma-70 family)